MAPIAKVLAIGGSDPSGGAGVQIDSFAISKLGAFPYIAITAITAQNSMGVNRVEGLPTDLVADQISAVLEDGDIDVAKTGMLFSRETVELVAHTIKSLGCPLVVDPVLMASDGTLLFKDAAAVYMEKLIPLATVVTPNIIETEALTGLVVRDEDSQRMAADLVLAAGARYALITGGHLPGDDVVDLLAGSSIRTFRGARISADVRGTGCLLASSIAAGLARGLAVEEAVDVAERRTHDAIAGAIQVGSGAKQAVLYPFCDPV